MTKRNFVIVHSNAGADGIRIPRRFTKKWLSTFTKPLIIKTRGGHEWKVKIEKRDRHVWFGRGWDSLKKHFQIQFMDVVLLKYEGRGTFDATIYSNNAVEISSHHRPTKHLPTNFFRPMVARTFRKKMALPDAFMVKHLGDLPHPIKLVDEDGLVWKINWELIDGSLWFTKGWSKFVIKYNLKRNDYVFFTYDGTPKMEAEIVRYRSKLLRRAKTHEWAVNVISEADEDATWTTTLSDEDAKLFSPLVVPEKFVINKLANDASDIRVKLPNGEIKCWDLIWKDTIANQCQID